MTAEDTRTAILDAAEELLADRGYAGTSLRAVTGRAGANLAAVHYHLGSKEELAKAVLSRRIAPINAERLRVLDHLEQHAAPPAPQAIVRAFLAPALELAGDPGARPCRIMGRLVAEQPAFLRPWLAEQFRPVVLRFARALARALPHVSEPEVFWRLHFMVGSMTHTMLHAQLLPALTQGGAGEAGPGAVLERLVAFCTFGVTASAAEEDRGGGTSVAPAVERQIQQTEGRP